MSDPAAPWWADVQHLRPREDHASAAPAPRWARDADARSGHGRDERERAYEEAAVATVEHALPGWDDDAPRADDPPAWQEKGAAAAWQADDAAWLETLDIPADPAPSRVWDASLEAAFASTPSWAEQDDERLLPRGANRIENGRRTIEIRGQVDRMAGFTAPAETTVATRTGRRRPARRPAERLAGRPDRVAMWAFLLGILLILIAALSSPGDAGAATLASF